MGAPEQSTWQPCLCALLRGPPCSEHTIAPVHHVVCLMPEVSGSMQLEAHCQPEIQYWRGWSTTVVHRQAPTSEHTFRWASVSKSWYSSSSTRAVRFIPRRSLSCPVETSSLRGIAAVVPKEHDTYYLSAHAIPFTWLLHIFMHSCLPYVPTQNERREKAEKRGCCSDAHGNRDFGQLSYGLC